MEVNWGKIAMRVFAAYMFLAFCRTITQTNSRPQLNSTLNNIATINASDPFRLTISSMRATERMERWQSTRTPTPGRNRVVQTVVFPESTYPYLSSFMTQYSDSADNLALGTPFVWDPPASAQDRDVWGVLPSQTPRPTSTPRPTRTSRPNSANTTNSENSSSNQRPTSSNTEDDEPWSLFAGLDVAGFRAFLLECAKVWLIITLPLLAVLWILNAIIRSLMMTSLKDMATQRIKRSLARILLLVYGILHLPMIAAFYGGVMLITLGFTAIYLGANKANFASPIAVIILLISTPIWILTVTTILRGFMAFHRPAGNKYYRLLPDEAPQLFDMLNDIAVRMKTSPVMAVWLTPHTEIEMYEQGAWLPITFARRKRVLRLGLAGLQHLTHSQLETLIVHQYQIFQRQSVDQAAGALIVQGRDSLSRMIERFLEFEYNTTFNYLWYMFKLFHDAYLTVTEDAVNLHTLLVDSQIAKTDETFYQALTDLDFVTHLFNIHSGTQIKAARANRSVLLNVYRTMFQNEQELEKAANLLDVSILYDSIQSDRFASTQKRLDVMSKSLGELSDQKPIETSAMRLFVDPDGLMQKMTIVVMQQAPGQ